MTVTYTAEVATSRLGCFLKLLRRWRGSIYKLIWVDLIGFLSMYYVFSLTYRFGLNFNQKRVFEQVVKYCYEYSDLIPLSFVLGFYVSVVMTRWWNQYTTIPFPDSLAVFVSTTIHGQDERGRVMRRTIMRYVCCCITMMFTMISPRVKKRFPKLKNLVEAGLLQQNEEEILAQLDTQFPKYNKFWVPIIWAASIITRARKEGRIRDDFAVKTLIDELNTIRGKCGLLLAYDNISIPLVYTQVVTLAVYSYFLTSVLGHQWIEGKESNFDLYFPVFITLQFFFYMGWLKVAETLINPFGDDDDDFEVNWMIDRNLQISYLIVDEMHHEHPQLVRDQYWDEIFPQELPYTAASEPFRERHPEPSTANIMVKNHEAEPIIPPSSVKIDDGLSYNNDMNSAPITFTAKTGSSSNMVGRMSNSDTSMRRSRGSQLSIARSRGSQVSLGNTTPDSPLPRINSVTASLKRLFSKEDKEKEGKSIEMSQVVSGNIPKNQPSIKRITEDVIEEVDEQSTITSLHNAQEQRSSILGLFGPPPPSQPISVPASPRRTSTSQIDPLFHSAPTGSPEEYAAGDKISIGGSDTDNSDDEFTRLKNERQEERLSRLKLNLARSLSRNMPETETELLLERRPTSPDS